MTKSEILLLNTAGFFLENVLGIWVFSQAFPKRKEEVWGWRLILNEMALHGLLLFIIFWNFEKRLTIPEKIAVGGCWLFMIALYRGKIVKSGKIKKEYRKALELIVTVTEFSIITGLISWNYRMAYISILAALMGNVFLPFFCCKYFECKLSQAYVWEMLYLGLVQILKSAYLFCKAGTTGRTFFDLELENMNTFSGLTFGIILYIIIFIVFKVFINGKILRKALLEYKWQMFLIGLTEILILNFTTDVGLQKIEYEELRSVVLSVGAMVFTIVLLLALLLKKTFHTEQQLLSIRSEAIARQYTELRSAYEENRCLIHDERHKLQYLRECMENDEYEKVRTFLGMYEAELESQRRKHWSPIATLDFILNMKIRRIEGLGIKFTVKTDIDSIKIDESDFVVLMGNLLDNAIEAAEKCPLKSRAISLWLKEVNGMFLITMENTAQIVPEQKNGRFLTSKKNKKEHGWGIQSMRHIVEKYGGDIEFKLEQGLFRVEITFWKKISEEENDYEKH